MMWGADMHIHTLYSHDSKETMAAYCQKAIALGIPSLCFTDHMDWFTHELPVAFDGLDGYFRELERLRKIYGEQLSILAGAEFGEPHVYEKKLQQLLQYPFDMVMASLHEIRDEQGSALVHLAKTQGWSLERAYRA